MKQKCNNNADLNSMTCEFIELEFEDGSKFIVDEDVMVTLIEAQTEYNTATYE